MEVTQFKERNGTNRSVKGYTKILFIKLKISVEMKVTQRTIEHILLAKPVNYGNKLS